MLILLAVVTFSPDARIVQLCKPVLARKAGGQIDHMSVSSKSVRRSTTIIRGQLTAFIGMPRAQAGSASAHHLIRADYHYSCSVRRGRILGTSLTQP
jgi:hypothetical protein